MSINSLNVLYEDKRKNIPKSFVKSSFITQAMQELDKVGKTVVFNKDQLDELAKRYGKELKIRYDDGLYVVLKEVM